MGHGAVIRHKVQVHGHVQHAQKSGIFRGPLSLYRRINVSLEPWRLGGWERWVTERLGSYGVGRWPAQAVLSPRLFGAESRNCLEYLVYGVWSHCGLLHTLYILTP